MPYTFMDFCAGIGCGRIGLEKAGFKCVAFSEINANSEITYRTFFGKEEENYGDLMNIETEKLPDFDLLIAGFPCQTFSVIGQRKGMDDPRGQVIFGIRKILKEKNIKYFILENVKGLVNHEGGKTIQDIVNLLDEAGYFVTWKVLNTLDYGLPQSRERVYFLGVRKDLAPFSGKLSFPEKVNKKSLEDFLIEDSHKYVFSEARTKTMTHYLNNRYNEGNFTIEDLVKKEGFIIDTRQSDLRFYNGYSPTLRTGRHGLVYSKNGVLRELSGFESLLLQGIPLDLARKTSHLSDQYLLGQAGNAMSVDVIFALGKEFMNFISSNIPSNDRSSTALISDSKAMISEGIRRHRDIQQLETK